jgi:hypothetical protein
MSDTGGIYLNVPFPELYSRFWCNQVTDMYIYRY